MPAGMTIGPPTLRVKDLQKQLLFYENYFGLQVNRRYKIDDDLECVDLGFKGKFQDYKEPLLILKHDPNAKQIMHNFAGLYHFAILVPDRKDLASAYLAIENSDLHFDGFADHLVSESLYLHDPELNGIEIYRDKPRDEWQHDADGHIVMDTLQLDLESILSELSKDKRKNITFPNGARIGHMHLRVTDLERSVRFYQKLGLDITSDWSAMGANFLSAGGYHHHIGLNTWHSLGGKAHEKGEAGLDVFEITVPDQNELLLSDPDRILILIKSY
jgi:catechol 2,3-dioxygenase